jgi:hypothetical protein
LDSRLALLHKRVLESRWEMPKGYWKASGKFLKGVGKPLGNAQIPIGEEIELPSSYWQKRGNFHPFSMKQYVSVYIY